MSSDSEDFFDEPFVPKQQREVEKIYQKKSPLEHVLLRPDTYIGTTESETDKIWVVTGNGQDQPFKMQLRDVTYVPGLYKIFDEILVNAADNKQRDPNMSELRVNIDRETNTISVYNNGQGIPVQIHREYNIYVPELIFGHLLTSSNYDDTEKKTVGGRNGYGAKLANIFSTEFIVETQDSDRKLRFYQRFHNNMRNKDEPKIVPAKGPSWTKITFRPDLAKFGMRGFDDDIIALFSKRVFDVAGCASKGLKVYLNDTRIDIASFKDYVAMYLPPEAPRVHEKISDRWEVVIADSDGHFQQVSFVNSICTIKGGTHVTYLADQLTKHLLEQIQKKNKNTSVKPFHIKNHLWIFVNSLIENPAFDSQTKVNLTSKRQSFGSDPVFSPATLKKLSTLKITENVLAFSKFKESRELTKNDGSKKSGRLLGIEKLEDANLAGSKHSADCTLILTEGDSAKALAMSGLSVVGRDYYGVFPLRGKLLNVREAKASQIAANAEITHLKQILGLQQGKVYTDTKSLRYGHVMIMTDQDHDGSHIKGLVINLFATFWPSLLKIPGFLTEFITPIVKATKGDREISFYTIPEYETWREQNNDGKGWTIKYYKGLGTSTAAEAKVYFSNIDQHQIPFAYHDDQCSKMIELAFSKTMADQRKDWMNQFVQGTFLNHAVSKITYQDFINKELILFSIASNQRAIPSMVDGLKPGQRKVLFACFKRKLTKQLKVAQLQGYIAEHTAYHHGEASLAGTIINMAQNFVGANNVNYLWPCGQFGTRAQGGKNAASARYIFTHLSPSTRALFHPADDPVLTFLNDDGQSIEPEWYVPVIPTVLVNGSSGIGTGWSSTIPNYNPRDIIQCIRCKLRNEPVPEIHPYYRGFIGKIIAKGRRGNYVVQGMIEKIDDTTVHIFELPIERWTSDYKEWLEQLQLAGKIVSFQEYHTDNTVSFVVNLTPQVMAAAEQVGLIKFFRLEGTLTTTNMVLFDRDGRLKLYRNPAEIFDEFYNIRMDYYQKRKNFHLGKLEQELKRLSNRMRFILAVVEEKLVIRNVKRSIVLEKLKAMGFEPLGKAQTREESENDESEDSAPEDDVTSERKESRELSDASLAADSKAYDYLLSMPLWSLTLERVQALKEEYAAKVREIDELRLTPLEALWEKDLNALEDALSVHYRMEAEEFAKLSMAAKKGSAKTKGPRGRAAADSDDDFDDFDDEDSEDDWGSKKKKKKPKKPRMERVESVVPDFVRKERPKEQTLIVEDEITEEPERRRGKGVNFSEKDFEDVIAMLDGNLPAFESRSNSNDMNDEYGAGSDAIFESNSNLMGEGQPSAPKTANSQKSAAPKKPRGEPRPKAERKPKGEAKPKAAKAPTTKKSKKAASDSESDAEGWSSDASDSFDSDALGDSDDDEVAARIASRTQAKPARERPRRAAAANIKFDEDSEDDIVELDDDESEEEVGLTIVDDDNDDDGDDDDDAMTVSRSTTKRKGGHRIVPESEDGDDIIDMLTKPSRSTSKPTNAKTSNSKPSSKEPSPTESKSRLNSDIYSFQPASASADIDDDELAGLSLMERLSRKAAATAKPDAPAKSTNSTSGVGASVVTKATKTSAKASAASTKAAPKKPKSKKPAYSDESEEDPSESEDFYSESSDEDILPKKSKKPAAAAKPKAATKKPKLVISDSEEESDYSDY